ncbi:MAG: hypothetical protein ACRYG7_01675 [Janthinobacterium lividum]
MKSLCSHFVALALAAVALSSCDRSYYSYQSKTAARSGMGPTAMEAAAPADAGPTVMIMPLAQSAAAAREMAPVVTPAADPAVQPTTVARPPGALVAVSLVEAPAPAQGLKLPVGQRLLRHRAPKPAARATARQQGPASVAHTTAPGAR